MSPPTIADAYGSVIAGLQPHEIDAIWLAALMGRRAPSDHLAEPLRRLIALRDRVGRRKEIAS